MAGQAQWSPWSCVLRRVCVGVLEVKGLREKVVEKESGLQVLYQLCPCRKPAAPQLP